MNWTKLSLTIALLLVSNANVMAQPQQSKASTGKTYLVTKSYETSEHSNDGSSGSSRGSDTLFERFISEHDGGLELQYEVRPDADPEEKARNWQLPARVFKPANGPMQLLNSDELEARLEGWLKVAKWDRAVCGHWIFTWNAFLIDCDPQSILKTIEAIDLRSLNAAEGAAYQDSAAITPGVITKKFANSDGATFSVILNVDPAEALRARADSDVVLGEIMRKPVTIEAALAKRANEQISGTIAVTLETDRTGSVWRRTKVTKLEIKLPDGSSESRMATETVERQPV